MNILEAINGTLIEAQLERAKTTARAYKIAINYSFRSYLASKKITLEDNATLITTDIIVEYASWLLVQHYKKKTIGVYLSAMRYFVEWLVIRGIYSPEYIDTIRLEKSFKQANKRREDRLIRHPAKEDIEKLRQAVRELDYSNSPYPDKERSRNIAIVELLTDSGCRNEEICTLKVGNLDLKKLSGIVIGKGSRERYIYLTVRSSEALKFYWDQRGYSNPNDPVFCRHDRGSIRNGVDHKYPVTTATIRNVIEACAKAAGIGKFTPHWFRHAFAIKLLHDTGNLALVQDALGHKSPETTRVYAKIEPEDLQEAHRRSFGNGL